MAEDTVQCKGQENSDVNVARFIPDILPCGTTNVIVAANNHSSPAISAITEPGISATSSLTWLPNILTKWML